MHTRDHKLMHDSKIKKTHIGNPTNTNDILKKTLTLQIRSSQTNILKI